MKFIDVKSYITFAFQKKKQLLAMLSLPVPAMQHYNPPIQSELLEDIVLANPVISLEMGTSLYYIEYKYNWRWSVAVKLKLV